MKIAIFSKTPLAAAPWEIYRALKKYTLLDVSLINETLKYYDGRIFPGHLVLHANNGDAKASLYAAEIWHVHNYLHPILKQIRGQQRVLAQFHSLPRLGNWHDLMRFADMNYTIAQPLQEKEYALPGLPNIIDPDEYRPTKRERKVTIAFAPTNRMKPGRPDSKGYHQVKMVLDEIASKKDVRILWIEGVEYYQNLSLKSQAHILIDDVVTGNWHRTSLEGACFGCAVINRVQKIPFVFANLATLKDKLLWLIENPSVLRDYQQQSRLWILQEWHAMDRIKEYVAAYKRTANAR